MSSPPVKYLRYFDFTTFATNNPDKPLPGASVDVELNRLLITTNQTIDRLAEIQRDDGSFNAILGTAQIQDKAVTEPKLADLSVSTRTLQDLCVTTAKIALLAVGSAQLSDLAVTQAKLGLLSVGTPQLIDLSVSTPKILDAAVTSPKLAPSLAFTGIPTAPTALTGTNTAQLATTAFVSAAMSAAGMITEAPNDGKLYGRQSIGWQLGVKLAGDTMTGPLTVPSLTATGSIAAVAGNFSDKLGVGRIPEAWGAAFGNVVCLGLGAAVGGHNASAAATLYSNVYFDGAGYKLITAAAASLAQLNSGMATWFTCPAGAAGANAPITEKLRLDNAGNLGLRVVPPAWQAGIPAISIGQGGAIGGAAAAGGIALYNNCYHDGAMYRRMTADFSGLYSANSGVHSWYAGPTGAAGADATLVQKMRLENGQLFAPNSFGGVSYHTKAQCAVNAAFDMFYIPTELTNLADVIFIYLNVTNDDANAGYASYSSMVMFTTTVFAGVQRPPVGNTAFSQVISVNAGVIGVGCNATLFQAGNLVAVRLTPTTSGASGATTCRVTAQIHVVGVDSYQAITRV